MGSPEFSSKLADHPRLPKRKTVAVVILDGWGEANPDQYNCIHVADTMSLPATICCLSKTSSGRIFSTYRCLVLF